MPDYGLTVSSLAGALGVSRQSVNELLRGRRAVSAEMALRLSRLFGNSAEFWLNAQHSVDLWDAARSMRTLVARIKPLRVAEPGVRWRVRRRRPAKGTRREEPQTSRHRS